MSWICPLQKARIKFGIDRSKKSKSVKKLQSKPNESRDYKISLSSRLEEIKSLIGENPDESRINTKVKGGFVYLIINPSWKDWIKVGMTLDYESRLSCYNVYDPMHGYKFLDIAYVSDRRLFENKLLDNFTKMSKGNKGEWFKLDKNSALSLFRSLVN